MHRDLCKPSSFSRCASLVSVRLSCPPFPVPGCVPHAFRILQSLCHLCLFSLAGLCLVGPPPPFCGEDAPSLEGSFRLPSVRSIPCLAEPFGFLSHLRSILWEPWLTLSCIQFSILLSTPCCLPCISVYKPLPASLFLLDCRFKTALPSLQTLNTVLPLVRMVGFSGEQNTRTFCAFF